MADEVAITGGINTPPQSVSTPKKEFHYGGGTDVEIGAREMYNTFEGSWTLGNWMTDKQNPRRATATAACWNWIVGNFQRIRMRGDMFGTDITKSTTPRLYRQEFYPVNIVHYGRDLKYYNSSPPKQPILAIELQVFCVNPKSPTEAFGMPYKTAMFEYEVPLPPKMTITYDEDTKELEFDISSDIDFTDTTKNQERYRTNIYELRRITSISGKRVDESYVKNYVNDGKDLLYKKYTFTTARLADKDQRWPLLFKSGTNSTIRSKLHTEQDYILYRIDTTNIGIRGVGPLSSQYYKSREDNDIAYVIGIPPKAAIDKVVKVGEYVQVRLKNPIRNSIPSEIRNYDTPAIKAELQRADATIKEVRDDPTSLNWDTVDNASGSVDSVIFQEPISSAKNLERGKYAYYRIKTTRGDMPPNYSEPVRSDLFHKEPLSAVGAKIAIEGWRLSNSGSNITLDLSWGIDEANQVEVTYSKNPKAWDNYDPSDENQQDLFVEVFDTSAENSAYADNKGSFTITGLRSENSSDIRPWYFRVRRKREDNNSFGDYNDKGTGTITSIYPVSYIDGVECIVTGVERDNKNEMVSVTVAWENTDPSLLEGTQFEWSTDDDLYKHSTADSSTYDVEDDEDARTKKEVTLNIHSISGGNTLRLRARRFYYDDVTGEISYSTKYSAETSFAITAEDDKVAIIDISENGDGESLKIRLGWDEDDSDGTEISWSKKAYAWESSSAPSTFNVDWDGVLSETSEYKYETTASIDGLEIGETYYIRARRYQEGNKTTYGSYTETLEAIPYSKPEDVVATAAEYHPKGKDLEVAWTFTSESEQTAYVIQRCVDDGTGLNNYVKADVIDSQNSDVNGVAIPADKVEQYAEDGVLRLIVTVATGGGSSDSDMLTINVVDAPTCEVEMSDPESIVNSIRDVKFKMKSPNEANRFVIQLVAHGAALSIPDKSIIQSYGDVLWSGEVNGTDLVWEDGVAEYVIPEDLATSGAYLIADARYELRVWAHDDFTSLSMEDPASAQFTVEFDEYPLLLDLDNSYLTLNEADSSVTIVPMLIEDAPENTEIYLYRHGVRVDTQVATGLLDGLELEDPYVPFGYDADLYYSIMVKTPDGNIQYYRIPYEFKKEAIRIDWGEGDSVELPFNLSPTDTYSKNFDRRAHLDGSANGFYSPGITHDGSATSAIFNVRNESDLNSEELERQRYILEQLRALRVYNDSVFVRTSDGAAFEANVDVKKIDPKYNSLLYDLSIEFKEIDTSAKYFVNIINKNIASDPEIEEELSEDE